MQSRKIMLNVSGIMMFLAAGAAAMFFMPSDTPAPAQPQQTPQPAPAQPVQEAPKPAPSEWYVYVTGAVNNPGVYKLPPDSRIFQAVDAAGGLTGKADQTAVNLAETLYDSAHIHIPEVEASPAPVPQTQPQRPVPAPQTVPASRTVSTNTGYYIEGRTTGTTRKTASTSNTGKVDVNHATAKELEQLTGVGPAIAKRIVEYRNTHGRFNAPEDLINVRGIGAAKLEKMRPQILIR